MLARIISMMNIRILALAGIGIFSIFGSLALRFINRRFPSVSPYETQEEKRQEIKEYGYDPVQATNDDEKPTYIDFLEDGILDILGEKTRAGRSPAAEKLHEIAIGEKPSGTPDPFGGFDKDSFIREQKGTLFPDRSGQTKTSQKQN